MKNPINFTRVLCLLSFVIVALIGNSQGQTKKNRPDVIFSNPAPITINTVSTTSSPKPASIYPSTISVSGMTGTITKVEVTLDGLSMRLLDTDFLLVSPTGAKFIFFSDGGGFESADHIYTFSDTPAAGSIYPYSGTYAPLSGDGFVDTFPAPAPAGPYSQPPSGTFASTFNGADPNGTWSLYAVDDSVGNSPGSLNSGWALTITTNGAPTTFKNQNYLAFYDTYTSSSPYGTAINVNGLSGAISNLRVTLNGFSHSSMFDVDVLLVSPNGKGVVILSDAGDTNTSINNVNFTFDDSAATPINVPIVSGIFQPTDNSGTRDFFPSPAPLAPYHQFSGTNQLSNFNGFSPNGEWRLYVTDSRQFNSGSISGGWSLEITTFPIAPPTPGSCSAPSFSPTSYPVGNNPTNLAVADFNNDGKADIATTNQISNNISILLGNGNGTFGAQTAFGAGSSPYAIVAGKFNADNNFDLAIANSGSNNVSILLGNGNGTFSAPTNFLVGSNPISIAAGDLNADSKTDLVVANFGGFFSGAVSVLLGNGTGGFVNGNTIRTRTQPSYVAIERLNNDSIPDILVANFGADSVSTYFGSGSGTFQLNQNITTGSGPVAIELADFLGLDSIKDLAVANYNSDSITVCGGTLSGGFTNCSSNNPAGGANPISITSASFIGGIDRQLATALSGSNMVSVITSSVAVGQNPNAIKSADFNADGKPDLVSANYGSNDVSILINSCLAAVGNIFDYDGDRRTDYSLFRPNVSGWFIRSLNPSGVTLNFARPNDKILAADFNGDKKTDFAFYRPENGLWFVIENSNRPIYFTQFGLAQDIPVPADFDGDGKADIAVWRPSEGNWYIRRSTDNVIQISLFGMSGDKPVPADFDGDGKDDIAVYRPSTGVWFILRSSDNQVYIAQFGIAEDKTVAGDYDADGKADIAVFRPSTGVWYVLRSSDGNFRAVAWGLSTDIPVMGDFDGDGKFDFAIWRPSEGNWYVLKSSDNSGTTFQWGVAGDNPIPNAFVR